MLRRTFKIILLTSICAISIAHATTIKSEPNLTKSISGIEQLVMFETQSNQVANRSFKKIELLHYEIPMRLLEKDIYPKSNKNLINSMTFMKDGERYVRWVINPEDTKWHLELKNFLTKHNVDATPKRYFEAYLTASRSLIAVDPQSGYAFSIKVSTDKTGGMWKDKKQTWEDAKQIRILSDKVMYAYKEMPTKHIVLDEPFAVGIPSLDQGLIIRSYDQLLYSNYYYVPGFSLVHDQMGKMIALHNNQNNPVSFVEENYAKPLGEALAELVAYTGLTFDSPHSQNFLIEFNDQMEPTGRIVLRDVGDTYLFEPFLSAGRFEPNLKRMEQDNIKSVLRNAVGIMHGNISPDWITPEVEKVWAESYFAKFIEKFSKITHIPMSALRPNGATINVNGSYYSEPLRPNDIWANYLRYSDCFMGHKTTKSGEICPSWITRRDQDTSCLNSFQAFL